MFHDVPYRQFTLFRSLLEKLKKKYTFISPSEFHCFLKKPKKFDKINILITFDDGFISSRNAAEQVLDPLDIKAIFFITVGFIGLEDGWRDFAAKNIFDGTLLGNNLNAEHRPMGWTDCDWLLSQGHTIGSHSINHKRLSLLDKEELKYEIFGSFEILKKNLGISIESFAYPFGDINSIDRKSIEAIHQQYKFCYSGIRGFNKENRSLLSILRDEISFSYSSDYVEFIIENGLGLRYMSQVNYLNKLALDLNN